MRGFCRKHLRKTNDRAFATQARIRIDLLKFIRGEPPALMKWKPGTVHSDKSVYAEYQDPQRDEWQAQILPALKRVPLALLARKCGEKISGRALIDLRAGRSRPRRKSQELLASVARQTGEA